MIKDLEEEKEPILREVPESSLSCIKCQKLFADSDQSNIIFIDECLHILCKPCLKEAIDKDYPNVSCQAPGCKAKIQDFEVRYVLG